MNERVRNRMFLRVLATVLVLAGCKDDAPSAREAPSEEVDWPERPADGSPVVAQFVRMIGEGNRLGADLRVFNFEDAVLTRLDMTLYYLDDAGEALKDFPYSVMSPAVSRAKGHDVIQVGAFVPESTRSMRIRIDAVTYQGDPGPRWKRPAE